MGTDVEIRETTQRELSGHLVAAINLLEREFPAEGGGSQRLMSAVLSIMDTDTDREWQETVRAGSVVALGADRYCVARVERGRDAPGLLVLRQVTP